MRRALFTILLFCVAIVRVEGQAFVAFTNKYGVYGTNFIAIAPWSSQGIFYEGDPVTISNSIGTTVEVYDFHGNTVTNAMPPVNLTNLKLGHYFVQVDGTGRGGFGDRSQFSVWPKGYTNYLHADIGEAPTSTLAESNRFVRMAPGFTRFAYGWSAICSNSAGTNDWTAIDRQLHGGPPYYGWSMSSSGVWKIDGSGQSTSVGNTPAPVQVLCIGADHYNQFWTDYSIASYDSPEIDETNTLSSWVNDVATIYSNAAVRYTNSFVYEILNEPDGAITIKGVWTPKITFSADQNPYTNGSVNAYPISLAVSASVQAIQFVCPSCQTWAPAVNGLKGDPTILTDSLAQANYTNVDMFSFHAADTLYGAVDVTLAYMGGGGWAPTGFDDETIGNLYGKQLAVTETYPYSPDVLGKTNSWQATEAGLFAPAYRSLPNTWQTMTFRFWKNLIEWRSTGVSRIQTWLQIYDNNINPWDHPLQYEGQDAYAGWDVGGEPCDVQGCGPLPSVDGQAMVSWWVNNGTPLANWLSGSLLTIANPLGVYTNGTPGLHFWTWQFADGSTNTFVWSDEQVNVTTNLGVGLTDIFSNQWTGPIGMEPVIAWGWPNNSSGGSLSAVPVAAFSATPTYGPAPMTVTFTDESAGAVTSRSWQFGDGFATNTPELTVIHQYTTPGSNTVQLIVNGPFGAGTNSQSNMVIVTPFPPPLNGGGVNGLPPVIGGNGSGTNSVQSANGGANSSWRFLIAY